jgi:hypothetical protein
VPTKVVADRLPLVALVVEKFIILRVAAGSPKSGPQMPSMSSRQSELPYSINHVGHLEAFICVS